MQAILPDFMAGRRFDNRIDGKVRSFYSWVRSNDDILVLGCLRLKPSHIELYLRFPPDLVRDVTTAIAMCSVEGRQYRGGLRIVCPTTSLDSIFTHCALFLGNDIAKIEYTLDATRGEWTSLSRLNDPARTNSNGFSPRARAQPIYDLCTGDIIGHEYLVDTKMLNKLVTEFFEVAEATDADSVSKLDFRLLGLTMDLAMSSPAGLKKSFNVKPVTLGRSDFPVKFVQMAKERDLDLRDVVVELHEEGALTSWQRTVLNELKQHHIEIWTDDVGSRHGENTHSKLELSTLAKLDLSIAQSPDLTAQSKRAFSATVQYCLTFGVKLLAEGCRTWPDVESVYSAGCRYVQAFLLGTPAATPTSTASREVVNQIERINFVNPHLRKRYLGSD
jgi:EAL domain-containing protein (putative c-di-GMP-specific phosphodiesterase class I)